MVVAFARLVRRLVRLPALLCCEAMVWSVTFLAFPIRMLSALERERRMGALVAEMQGQMDGLVWENKDLEERLRAALKEQDAMEAVLDEMEEEHEDALARIDALENQIKALKLENTRLIEHKGKARWDNNKATAKVHGGDSGDKLASKKKSPSDSRGRVGAEQDAFEFAADPLLTPPPAAASSEQEDALAQQQAKAVARRRSLFSLGMSLAVGAVAWSADAPCLPLLAGLFAVVGVSMLSVSRSRRAADAVALLSLNWFLLGALTSPMLPGVARALVPRAGRALGPAITWAAATAPL